MASVDGELVGLPRDVRARLEGTIAARTGARFEARGGSGEEYWVIGRRDLDSLLLGVRLQIQKARSAPKGALAPELCELLVRASSPGVDDVFLDPFAGSGSLVLSRLDHPGRKIIYSDLALRQLKPAFRPELARARRVTFLAEDARDLPSVEDATVDAIVTDPPWGEYEDIGEPYEDFTAAVASGLRRVLKPKTGRLVLLVSRRNEEVLQKGLLDNGLTPRQKYPILVNGHPATVLVGLRDA
jgi:23S rRNA G2445 N2-methylase RlmL